MSLDRPLLVRAHGRTYVDRATVIGALEHALDTEGSAWDMYDHLAARVEEILGMIDTESGY